MDHIQEITEQARAKHLAKITPLYRDATTGNPVALAWIEDPHDTLYLYGPVGTGKTWTAHALWRSRILAAETYRDIPLVECWPLEQYLHYLRPGNAPVVYHKGSEYGDPSWTETVDVLDAAQRADLLILDDVGCDPLTSWGIEQLFTVIDHRYTHMLPTIITSNVVPRRLAEATSERIASRLGSNATIIEFTGRDRRRQP